MAGQSARYRNHGDAAPVVLLSGRENRFTRLVETASLLGTSLGQFASAGLREKQRDISALGLRPVFQRSPGGRDRAIGKGGAFIQPVASWEVRCYPQFLKLCRNLRTAFLLVTLRLYGLV
ncbi:hypothetical protein CHARACLAT_030008 [Characodon lateralis]|uniref:Uncharacterized protein n=1 Tax=Characodon lateralis TaxID=208331 RepID=A0ABU7DB72_9TELE|nr:hypothetical protein [Characodon lateralis]